MAVAMSLLRIACVDTEPGVVVEPRCGDGVVQDPEVCDDGDLNGTSQSFCTIVCGSDELNTPYEVGRWLLPVPAKWAESNGVATAFTNYDNEGLWVINDFTGAVSTVGTGQLLPAVKLFVHAAPTSAAFGVDGIFWIEQPYGGIGPKMYTTAVPVYNVPVVREIPYPFPQGEGGQIFGATIFDRGIAAPHTLLSADMIQDMFQNVVGYRSQFDYGPSPGQQQILFSTSRSSGGFDLSGRRIVRFFQQPQSLVVQRASVAGGYDSRTIVPSEINAVGAASEYFGRYPKVASEFAVVDQGGSVRLHTFICDEAAQEVPDVYARLEAGTRNLWFLSGRNRFLPMLAVMPSGSVVSVENSGDGRGLRPQELFKGLPCEVCNTLNSAPLSLTFDRTLILLGFRNDQLYKFKYSPDVPFSTLKELCDRN
jgi:hypothetical protein